MRIFENERYFACVNARLDYADRKGGTHEEKLKSIIRFDSYSRYADDDGTLLNIDIEDAKMYAIQSRNAAFSAFSERLNDSVERLATAKDRENMIETLNSLSSVYGAALTEMEYNISLSVNTLQIIDDIIETGNTDASDDCIRDSLEDYYSKLLELTAYEVFGDTEKFELAAAACINLSNASIYPETINVRCASEAAEITVNAIFCREVSRILVNPETRKMLLGNLAAEIASLTVCAFFAVMGLVSIVYEPNFWGEIIFLLFGAFAISDMEEILKILLKLYPQGLDETPAALKFRDTLDIIKQKFGEIKHGNRMENESDMEELYECCNHEFEDCTVYEF